MHYQILVNPRSGNGKGQKTWHVVAKCLQKLNIPYQASISQFPGQPQLLAHSIGEHHQGQNTCLIVIGGDGTLHESINGLMKLPKDHQLPVGYIPAGTGNDFARGYGISRNPLQALKQILLTKNADLINVGIYSDASTGNKGILLNNLGIGFDASIVHLTNSSISKKWLNQLHLGNLSYTANAIKVIVNQPTFRVTLRHDGATEIFNQASILIASNHPFIGGGFKVASDESVYRKELELVIVERKHLLSYLWSIGMFASGHLIHSHYAHIFHGTDFQYSISSPQNGQTDGEALRPTPFQLHLTCGQYPIWQTSIKK